MKIILYLLVLALILIGGFYALNSYIYNEKQGEAVTPPPSPQVSYKDASYIFDGQSITLANGLSEIKLVPDSEAKLVTRYFGNEAQGDLNGDGMTDVAFIVTQNSGGTGTFYYVVVALKTETGYAGTNAILLGDRIAPQTTEIKDGIITVNYATRKSDEPMTASPSVGVSKRLKVSGVGLLEA